MLTRCVAGWQRALVFCVRTSPLALAVAHPRYFRTTLTLPEGLQPHDVIMGRMQVDDGAAVYLNGREVYRCYLPAGPGTPLYFELKPKGKAGAPRDMECVSRALYCMHACTHCAVGRERRIAIARFELHRGRTACRQIALSLCLP